VIRGLLLDFRHTEMQATTEILLFAASRAQHVGERIRPVLRSGGTVICDRFADSTYAYQGYGLGRDLQELEEITRIATGGLQPDLTIFLDIAVADGLTRKRRAAARDQQPEGEARTDIAAGREPVVEWNRLDAREITFHERVLAGYHALMAAEPARWFRFDANLDRDTLATQIWQAIEARLARIAALQGVHS
jgi:dTMP kinase